MKNRKMSDELATDLIAEIDRLRVAVCLVDESSAGYCVGDIVRCDYPPD